ncbi:hypothetical protein SAMN05444266_104185 [Chitinophaga jiangningensis]|uniref:Prenyltransferase and squalene oxidase repeat-containing protein n=1 Tax=Chitinophaga jiangningensis TaxID=1419482 RepID=A0A1M7C3Z6_9BACT|nr:hypothetical protein [Chitinophaga jiangningensis]SHL61934.1 hypothetical protein SAMN05444266_104185 [Chitinophaga jiangningensis]
MRQFTTGMLLCLTLSSIQLSAQTKIESPVQTISWERFKSNSPTTPQRKIMGEILLNTNKYALTTWWDKHDFTAISSGEFLDLKGTSEHKIRPVAAEAQALAISLRMGLYLPEYTGVPVSTAEEKTIQLIRSLAHAHLSNKTGGWGKAWQSPLWACYTAFAAWAMWDKIDTTTQQEVLAMINSECAWVMSNKGAAGIKTYRNKSGEIVSPGDTGAEENAWDASILGVACAMMPQAPQQQAWKQQLIKLTLNAMARPSDVESKQIYSGSPLSTWLTGSNINEDGTVVNHHFIHPDYMTAPFELNATKYFWLANQPIPLALKLNSEVVFQAFADLKFHAGDSIIGGKVQVPGGSIFKAGTGNIFYPIGTDWGQSRRMNFAVFNSIISVFTNNKNTRKRATAWELMQAQMALDMQKRFEDGHTYLNKREDSYASCEEWVADAAMTGYIMESLKAVSKPVFTNE